MFPDKADSWFFVVGPQRCATSWLHKMLLRHPQIGLPANTKETFFFDQHYERGVEWYRSLYGDGGVVLHCEVAPTYFHCPEAPGRISAFCGDAKIVVCVRNPIARAYSLILHEFAKGRLNTDVNRALTDRMDLIARGSYRKFVPVWECAFGESNVYFLEQDEISREPQSAINRLLAWLNIRPLDCGAGANHLHGQRVIPRHPQLARVFASTAMALRRLDMHWVVECGKAIGLRKVYDGGDHGKHALSPEMFERLYEVCAPDIDYLRQRLNISVDQWRRYSDVAASLEHS